MNFNSRGKQGLLRETIIHSDDPHIPSDLHGTIQKMVFPANHPDPELACQPKGIKVVLQERGLWQYYEDKAKKNRTPPLVTKCSECRQSAVARDARLRASRLIKEAEANGYFLSEDQCGVQELGKSTSSPVSSNKVDCCWSKILSLQSDFLNEKPLLKMVIEEAGHVCLFLPKFHCELNPIELFWSYIKSGESSVLIVIHTIVR